MYKFYLPYGEESVTAYYNEIIRDGIKQSGNEVIDVKDFREIGREDKVIVISARMALSVWMHNPKQDVFVWIQGVGAEESLMYTSLFLPIRYLKYIHFRLSEYIVMRKARAIFFVSQAMKNYYEERYGTIRSPFIIMPCFNTQICRNAFWRDKYTKPTFVYTGGFQKWQCVDNVLAIYQRIKYHIPTAQLTFLTSDLDNAKSLLKNMNVVGVKIKHVPSNELLEELRLYKYGFIWREDVIVNNVATPTKMSNYLAAGVIPIFTTAINDFSQNLSLGKYGLIFHPSESADSVAVKIANFDREKIDVDKIRKKYEDIFSSYYSRDHYLEIIMERKIFKIKV